MLRSELRLLFDYDRWATRRVLNAAEDVPAETWTRPAAIGERSLGAILVHALGAHLRWRSGWQGLTDRPRPELEPLPTPAALRAAWETEWATFDAWFDALPDDGPNVLWNGWPLWQPMVHVVNHGTQHRSEAAALLTAAGHSPGELDLVDLLSEGSQD